MMKNLLILIDGNSLINRAFYALPPLNTADGRPSQAVYGFCNMLIKAINDYHPTHAAVAFDLPAPTFRHKQYAGYKATRKGMPDELACQLPLLKTVLADMGIKILEKEGFEADDILGTMSDCGMDNIIITGDRDALQLIDGNTKVAFTKKGISQVELYDKQKFVDEFCFEPLTLIDYKALCGDASDNIPGVSGIGSKTASALLCEYGSLEGVYQNIDSVKGKMREKLESERDMAQLSYQLATIDRKVPMETAPEDCVLSFPFSGKVKDRFVEYNFRTLAARAELFSGEENCVSTRNLNIKAEEIADLSRLDIVGDFAVLVAQDSVIIGTANKEYKIKLGGDLLGGVFLENVLRRLQPQIENDKIQKTMLDGKAFMKMLSPLGIKMNNYFDVKLAQYLLDVNGKTESAEDFCAEYGYTPDYPACALLAIGNEQRLQLKEQGMDELYYKIELPLVSILHQMEEVGFKLNLELNKELGQEFSAAAALLATKIYEQCGREFNINSPKQLAVVLFEEMQIPYPKRTKNYSTAFEILDPLREDYPVVDMILDYRRLTKLFGTYIEGLSRQADSKGVVHTDFKQTMTVTGRLSSAEPNLQNIPVREDDGRRLRGLFVAREGMCLISADYSQIELRLLAHFSGDKTMVDAFERGEDIHKETAAKVYNVPLSEVTAQMRRAAKAVNFGIIYGISDFGLSRNLGVSASRARGLIDTYFEKFSGIKAYLDRCVDSAKESGEARTLFGRVRRLTELKSPNFQVRKFGERAAMNTPLQGSAADIIKVAMIRVAERLVGTQSRLILQVHDELIVEAEESEANAVRDMLVYEMENVIKLNVPLKVDAGIGKTWLDC